MIWVIAWTKFIVIRIQVMAMTIVCSVMITDILFLRPVEYGNRMVKSERGGLRLAMRMVF